MGTSKREKYKKEPIDDTVNKNMKIGTYKKKRVKKAYSKIQKSNGIYYYRGVCPFCGEELEVIGKRHFFYNDYAGHWEACGAERVDEECPSCKHYGVVWVNSDMIYVHVGYVNCGFVSLRLQGSK